MRKNLGTVKNGGEDGDFEPIVPRPEDDPPTPPPND